MDGNRAWKEGREKGVETRKVKGMMRRKGIRIVEKERGQITLPYLQPTFHFSYCLCYPCVAGSCLPLLSGGGGGGGWTQNQGNIKILPL